MLIIANISEVYSNKGKQTYAVSLNRYQLTTFNHKAELGMAECLRLAAEAIEATDVDKRIKEIDGERFRELMRVVKGWPALKP